MSAPGELGFDLVPPVRAAIEEVRRYAHATFPAWACADASR